MIRSLFMNFFFYLITLIATLMAIPTFMLPQRYFFYVAKFWCYANLWMLGLFGLKFELRGTENIPKDKNVIFAPKHQSTWDVFALFTLCFNPSVVIKKELIYLPLFGWCLAKSGAIRLDRGSGGAALKSLIRGGRASLAGGQSLLIYPEGTRRASGDPPSYKYGITALYASLGVDVVPVALNSGYFWPRRTFMRGKGTIIMEVLPVIEAGLPKNEFAAKLQETIEVASQKLLDEAKFHG